MFFSFGLVADAALVVLGTLWCREMFGRWRRDLAEIRSTQDATDRGVILALWAVTGLIVVLLLDFALGLLSRFGVL